MSSENVCKNVSKLRDLTTNNKYTGKILLGERRKYLYMALRKKKKDFSNKKSSSELRGRVAGLLSAVT